MPKELKKILYAEDEEDIRSIAQIALEDIGGLIVIYCSNGREVLEKIKTDKPDLLLLDVMMPEMDGPTALQKIREELGETTIPVIFMTAKIQSNEIEEYKKLNVISVIAKPFDPMTLTDDIKRAWNKHYGQ